MYQYFLIKHPRPAGNIHLVNDFDAFVIDRMNSSIQWCLRITVRVKLMCNSSIGWVSMSAQSASVSMQDFKVHWSVLIDSFRVPVFNWRRISFKVHPVMTKSRTYMRYKRKWPKCHVRGQSFAHVPCDPMFLHFLVATRARPHLSTDSVVFFKKKKNKMSFHDVLRCKFEALPFGCIFNWRFIIFRRATGAIIY